MPPRRPYRRAASVALLSVLATIGLSAQATDDTPSFTLATSHVFSSRERPAITLVYRRVDHLDFRAYKVDDVFTFFSRLRDAHRLGSEPPVVPRERTWLERIAFWKAGQRTALRQFARSQFSPEDRRGRRRPDADAVVLRRTLDVNAFAQVPVLNASQLVMSWRELLPPVKDAEYRRIPLDLSAPGVYVIEAVSGPLRAYSIVIRSDLGLVSKTAPGQLLVYAANRLSGAPQAGCRVEVLADQRPLASGVTAADGTLETAITVADDPDNLITLAQCGDQIAATDPGAYAIRQPSCDLAGYIYTDRPVYRPGHTVRFKAVLRWREHGGLLPLGRDPVEVTVVDDAQKVIVRESKTVDAFGAVTGSLTLPRTAALGYYMVRVTSGEFAATGAFEVQEYRKPEYDVAVRPSAARVEQGGQVSARIEARYYFGQPVANALVKYAVHRQPYSSPLRYEAFADGDEPPVGGGYAGGVEALEGTVRLDAQGIADFSIPLGVSDEGQDYLARIEARVTDAAGREVVGAGSMVATYGGFLLIASNDRFIYTPGATAAVTVRALDYDGRPQAGARLHFALERVEYDRRGPPRVTALQESDATADAEGRASWSSPAPAAPGSYRVRVTAPSDQRMVSDTAYFYVPGARAQEDATADRYLELIADRRSYQPGDSARLVLRGADFDAAMLITKESQQVSYHRVMTARANEAIDLPITDDDVGDTYVSIVFLKDDRLYRAERRLSVPATRHQLTVTAVADKPIVRPGEPGVFSMQVVDAEGKPVRAQLSLSLVDEALYGVRPDLTPDPLRFFYRREYNRVSTQFSREYSFVGYSGTEQLLLAERRRRRPLTFADFKSDRPDRPRVRKEFPDTAFWAGDLTTTPDGRARVAIDYPDSLTSWRLTVRAVTTATDVGTTRARTTTTKDVILRVIAPRFLTEGDTVSIPTIVHNYLPEAKTIALSFSADGLTPVEPSTGAAPRTAVVAPGGEQRDDWRFRADAVQPVTVTARATSDAAGDAVQLSWPVRPAGLQHDTGVSGAIAGTGERQIELGVPPAANASARSVRVSLAPSMAGALLGALDYLTAFPWGCTEQILSSFVPNLVVLRAMAELKIAPAERLNGLDRQVSDGLKRLYGYQHADGGWGWWKTDGNHPFMTAYALDGLLQARDGGAQVEGWRIDSARRALEQLFTTYPRALPDLKAYELYVLTRASPGGAERTATAKTFDIPAAIEGLWSARSRMSASGRALLLMTLDFRQDERGEALARELIASAETRGDVSWWKVGSDALLEDVADTSVEGTALALQALAGRDPQHPLLERVARWLMANRSAGAYWISTKQTALALRGLLAFMRARGEQPSPVAVDVFVNGVRAGTHAFDIQALTSPDPILIEQPAAAGANTVRLVTRGEGTVYYDASVRFYDRPAAAAPSGSRQLALVRQYTTLSPVTVNGRIVYREGPFSGTARPGDLLLVRLTAAGSPEWRYLMIEDPIPAGTEAVEQEEVYELEQRRTWRFGSQREFRDDRTVFFQYDFTAGRYEYSYLLRVTTPGTFSAMPARISPMYVPDVTASTPALTVAIAPGTSR